MRPTRKALALGTGLALAAGFLVLRAAPASHSHLALHSPKAPFAVHGGKASAGPAVSGPTVVRLVAQGSTSARSLRERPAEQAAPRRRELEHPRPLPASPSIADTASQTSPLAKHSPLVISSFAGLGQASTEALGTCCSLPPDTVGDVGPSNYVEMTNTSWAVYNKAGTKLFGPIDNRQLWSGLSSGLCRSHDDGDPIVVYDSLANRWVLSQFASPQSGTAGGFHECIAVSKTSNPAGAYWSYDYLISSTLFNDYPKIGVWPDGYYLSFNDFTDSGFEGVTVAAFPRVPLLSGLKQNGIEFTPDRYAAGPTSYSMIPADFDGRLQPPAGSPEIFAEYQTPPTAASERVTLFALHANFTTPSASTFAPIAGLATAPFTDQFCPSDCIRQKGTGMGLDDESDRLMQRLAYRNYGGGVEALVLNHTVRGPKNDAGGKPTAAVRWYELRKHSGIWSIYQQSTFQPNASASYPLSRWMGSAAMDGTHDLAVGYSASSHLAYPSIRYAGRTPADPLGKLEAETTIQPVGTGAQTEADRWGDYTAMSIDPADDCTFWYLGEYYTATQGGDWHTRIGSFRFPNCVGISSVSPGSGARGSTITINGVGFTTSAVVKVNGVSASKTFVSSHQLKAVVPSTASTGRVTVTQGTSTVYSPASFLVTG